MIDFLKRIIKITYVKAVHKDIKIKISVSSDVGRQSKFQGFNIIGKRTVFSGQMGYGTYIGSGCSVYGKIGKFCSIADDVRVIIGNHPARKFVSTAPCFFSTKKQNGFTFVNEQKFDEGKFAEGKYPVVIGNDVWIGNGARIIAGVKIGDGAIIAAGAVVNKDVEDYSIVGGVPAKEIRKRFEENEIEFLQKLRWWDKPIDWIKDNAEKFCDIRDLM